MIRRSLPSPVLRALMRGGVVQLDRWGLLPAIIAAGTPPVRSTTFSYTGHDVTVEIEPKFDVDALYAPRRAILDRVLVDASTRSGAELRFGVRVRDVVRDGRRRVRGIIADGAGALRDAELLARAVLRGTSEAFADYGHARHDLSRQLFEVTDEIASLESTDERVQSLHRALSAEMSREVRALAALQPLPCLLPPARPILMPS